MCCADCWLRSEPLPWDSRTIARTKATHRLALDVIPFGPEQMLGTQLYVHQVPVFAGYIPIALARWNSKSAGRGGNGGMSTGRRHKHDVHLGLRAECERHTVCNTSMVGWSQTATRDLRPDADGDNWPPCPTDRVSRCRRFLEQAVRSLTALDTVKK
eukprot:CAMPEP_0174760520 /NCGR_PEP_ID=MMETSP1094-20130205/108815_1 /TAXON_ID=156173 /ORGANISM="Chrysochromulina brevifilum, Strain UTEX LB 985" /LENGTH=156 /DNA_ID=CAMNT_0015966461 /DNA_START=524 /DNA_END=994 /DNA_ORIENTATION=+